MTASLKLLDGFVEVATWFFLSHYMDLTKFFFMYLSPLAKQNQVEVWQRFQILKFLLWTKGFWMSQSTQCLGSVVPWAMFFTSAFNLIDNVREPLIKNPFPQFIIGLFSSQKPYQTEPTLQNQYAGFQRTGDIIGENKKSFLYIFSFLLTREKICYM